MLRSGRLRPCKLMPELGSEPGELPRRSEWTFGFPIDGARRPHVTPGSLMLGLRRAGARIGIGYVLFKFA